MKKPHFPLAALVCVSASLSAGTQIARADTPPPALREGVRIPASVPLALRPGDIAPPFVLPGVDSKLVSSRAWLSQRSLLVLSLAAPAPNIGLANPPAAPILAAPNAANAPLTPEQVLAARRISEAVRGAAPRLQKRGVVVVVVAGGPYFEAMKGALGPDFKAFAVPEVIEPDAPNLFLLQDDAPGQTPTQAPGDEGEKRVSWSDLAGPSDSGVALTGIDMAGFVRANEGVSDLLNLEALLSQTGDVSPVLEVGKPAPDFSVRDDNGRPRRLSDLRGHRNLLLSFFPKCFTGGCSNHLSSLGAEARAFASMNTEIWTASFDPAAGDHGQIAFAHLLGITFPIIPDVSRSLAMLYQAALSPDQPAPSRMTVLIDRDGIVRFIDRAVQVRTHGPDMLLKMRELGMK